MRFSPRRHPDGGGWAYHGNDINDPGINNATLTRRLSEWPPISRHSSTSEQPDGMAPSSTRRMTILQIVLSVSVNSSVKLTNKGQWIKYPYARTSGRRVFSERRVRSERPDAGRSPHRSERYVDRTTTGVFPGDDTPEEPVHAFCQLQVWRFFAKAGSSELVATGRPSAPTSPALPTGSNQVQTDTAGQPIVLYMPSQLL